MDERTQEIVDMLSNGIPPKQVALEMGMSQTAVRNVMKAQGLGPGKALRTPLLDVQAIAEAYVRGDPVPNILHEHDITYTKLYKVLGDLNIPIRKVADADARKMRMDTAVQMYEAGAPLWQIKQETGVHQPTLTAELHKRGVPLRRPRTNGGKHEA
jgi:hypothetical protein